MKPIMDYEVREYENGYTMVVACPRGSDYTDEMCDKVRDVPFWSLAELREFHKIEFGSFHKFGRAWFIPFRGGRLEITPRTARS